MHVLHLDTGRSMRGGQYQALLLIEGLQKQGHSQILLAREPLLDRRPGRPHQRPNSAARRRRRRLNPRARRPRAYLWPLFGAPPSRWSVSRRVAFEIKSGVFSRWKYSRPNRYLAVSEYVAGKLSEAGVEPSRIEVVHDAVPAPAEGQPPLQRTNDIVAPYSDDPLKEHALLRSAAQQAGLPLRFSTDLRTDLPTAGAFAYLSASEGLGSAILRAMVHRVPVVASRVGGIPEIVEHEQTGLLVNNNAEEIADALKRFRQDPDLAQACAERAYEQILERFTVDIMVRRTERVYREILGLPTPS